MRLSAQPIAIALAILAPAALAAPASASLVAPASSQDGVSVYFVLAGEGETNDVVVDYDAAANATRVTDSAGIRLRTLPPGIGPPPAGNFHFCEQRSPTEAMCPGPPGGGDLGDGDDRFEVRGDPSPLTARIEDLVADSGGSVLIDVTQGVRVHGGPGNDTIIGSPGYDELYGGPDGAYYGTGDDVLVGRETGDYLVGSDGNDHVDGGPGNDLLSGNEGDDVLVGGDGDDYLEMFITSEERGFGAGDDRYEGGPGDDVIRSSFGTDRVDGGPGDDEIQLSHYHHDPFGGVADDAGRANVDCAQGNDAVEVGRGDTLRGCERLKIHMSCSACSRMASLAATVRGRRFTVARKRLSHTPRRAYDMLPFAAGARRALARQGSVRVKLRLGSTVVRTFKLKR